MPVPNMFILYVSDAPESARFYSELFGMRPSFEDPGFVAFDLAGGVQLALWSGASRELAPSRANELCLTLDGGAARIDRQFHEWANENAEVVEEPHDAVFGRTFVISDLDGNLVRVAPVD